MRDYWALPSCVERFESRDAFGPTSAASYIYGESVEQRSHLPDEWMRNQAVRFIKIEELDYSELAFTVSGQRYPLRSRAALDTLVHAVLDADGGVYLDITGLSHHVWAPLISIMTQRIIATGFVHRLNVVYVEPGHYTKAAVPLPGSIFALSEETHGVRPIPGFARLRRRVWDKTILVALLGFEGWRFHAIVTALEQDVEVHPVIGVPGFRAEYPFYTLEGNALPLERDDNWMRRKLATANDPFEVCAVLRWIAAEHEATLLRIAMVGTKPHALGGVLYTTLAPERSELVYDNPIRKAGRTDADRRVIVYDVTTFLQLWTTSL